MGPNCAWGCFDVCCCCFGVCVGGGGEQGCVWLDASWWRANKGRGREEVSVGRCT
jgi:hypothetical protein